MLFAGTLGNSVWRLPTSTGVEDRNPWVPATTMLRQNYPNPFNPTTVIEFSVANAVTVELSVVDVLGRTVAVIVKEAKPAGDHRVHFDARDLPSGVYFYSLSAGDRREARRMILMK
jgi:hypothetical protein